VFAKHYENPTMLSKVTAKNVGDVFLRHTVVTIRRTGARSPWNFAEVGIYRGSRMFDGLGLGLVRFNVPLAYV